MLKGWKYWRTLFSDEDINKRRYGGERCVGGVDQAVWGCAA